MTTMYEVGNIPEFTLPDRLAKARSLTGLNSQDFAVRIGVSQKTINNAESGKHGVRKIVLNAWAMATGVPAQWLETGIAPDPDNGAEGQTLPRLDSNQEPSGSQPPQVTRLREWPKSATTIQRAA